MAFLLGMECALSGVARLATTPSLWAWAWAPIVVALWLCVGILKLMKTYAAEPIADYAHEKLGGSEWADWVATGLMWTLGAVLLYFTFSGLVRVVAAPLLVLLADRTVARMSGRPTPAAPGGPFMRWILRPFGEAIIVLAIRLAVTLIALPLLLIPVAGAILFALVSMALLGLDLMDIAQSARGILLEERLRFIRRNKAACLGLGVGAGLLMLIPCINVLLLPAAVVAAVLLDERLAPDFPRATPA